MRTFISVRLSKSVRERIAGVQEELKDDRVNVKWISPENVHITLKFLGEVSMKALPEVCESVRTSTSGVERFSIGVDSLGFFPGNKSPRVIWAGISEGKEELKELGRSIEDNLSELGFKKENREFAAHITIGRVRSQRNIRQILDKLDIMKNVSCGTSQAEAVCIMRSELTSRGPIYSILERVNLL